MQGQRTATWNQGLWIWFATSPTFVLSHLTFPFFSPHDEHSNAPLTPCIMGVNSIVIRRVLRLVAIMEISIWMFVQSVHSWSPGIFVRDCGNRMGFPARDFHSLLLPAFPQPPSHSTIIHKSMFIFVTMNTVWSLIYSNLCNFSSSILIFFH